MIVSKDKIRAIVWDWNGTMLNDVVGNVVSVNYICGLYDVDPITVEYYKTNFSFPVIEFYEKLGFDFEKHDFDKISVEYIEHFKSLKDVELYPDLKALLEKVKRKGIKQYVLSAMENDLLHQMLEDYGILQYFDIVQGTGSHHAHSKIDYGHLLLSKIDIPKENIIMIGDTLHDAEVAKAVGIDSVLVASGHNSRERLEMTGVRVFDNPTEAVNSIIE